MGRQLNIGVRITRNYGKHSIEFMIAEWVEVENGNERRAAYDNLLAQLIDEVQVYEHVHLKDVRLPQESAGNGASDVSRDTFVVDKIIVEHKDGEVRAKATGGKWKRFGVPIYPECERDIELKELPLGSHDLSEAGLVATIELEGGTAKRVISIK